MSFVMFLSDLSLAEKICNARDKSLKSLEDVVHHSLLTLPACSGMKSLWDNREHIQNRIENLETTDREIYDKWNDRFVEAYRACHTFLYNNCYPDQKSISEHDLTSLFNEFKKDPLLRMPEPASRCVSRATILAERLSKMGYKVEMVKFTAPTLVGIVRNQNNEIVAFNEYSSFALEQGFHVALSIEVDLPNGKKERRILDPQYADEPLSLDVYSKQLTGDICVPEPSRKEGCKVEYSPPVITDKERFALEAFLNGDLKLTNACGWNLLENSKQDIQEINRTMAERALSKPLPTLQTQFPEAELRHILHLKNLNEKIESLGDLNTRRASQLERLKNTSAPLPEIRSLEAEIQDIQGTIRALQVEIKIRENNKSN